jgi:hypothetical protein
VVFTPLANHSDPALLVASQAGAPTNFAVWRGAAITRIRTTLDLNVGSGWSAERVLVSESE